MQLASIMHQPFGAFAHPIGSDQIRLLLRAAASDLAGVEVLYGDRYQPFDRMMFESLALDASSDIHDYWTVLLSVPTRRLRYAFHLYGTDGVEVWLHEGGVTPGPPGRTFFFQYAYDHPADRFNLPGWLPGRTAYQIFPDRFAKGSQRNDPTELLPWGVRPTRTAFFGGDLAGIASRLDYLNDLGIGIIYLTPIFKSPSNHKYDTADYLQVDPAFGTNDDLRQFVQAAHERDFRVILDGVFNHAGSQWFAFRDVVERGSDSTFWDWFCRIDSVPINMRKVNYETFGCAVASMPKLNTANRECAEYLMGVGEYWLRHAQIDGWRLDTANEVNHGFWRTFRQRMKRAQPDMWLLGEVWHDATPWLLGEQFDSVTDYPWRDAVIGFLKGQDRPSRFAARLAELRFRYPLPVQVGLLRLLGSHDTPRIRTLLGGSIARAMQAAVLLLTAPGVPLIYYGDEVGMQGGQDPDCRRCMIWDGKPETGLQVLYRQLIHFRRRHSWLAWGGWRDVIIDDERGLYAYRRSSEGHMAAIYGPGNVQQQLWVVLNQGKTARTVELPLATPPAALVELISGQRFPVTRGRVSVRLPPRGQAVLVPESLLAGNGNSGE